MRVFRMTYRATSGTTKATRKWAVEFRDHRETLRRLAGFTDRAQTLELGRKIEKLTAARANGEHPDVSLQGWFDSMPPRIRAKLAALDLLNERQLASGNGLPEHLKDFRSSLDAKASTKKHVAQVVRRLERIFSDCGFRFYSDLDAVKFGRYLDERRRGEEQLSAQSFNFYLQALKQFCRWMVAERRAAESPVSHLKALNVRADRRHDRRALSPEEMRWLLGCTEQGALRQGKDWSMTGPERALLYRVAMETGLRASELKSLTPPSFDVDGSPPTVTVRAAYSKRRREDTLPLRAETARLLADYLRARRRDVPAFDIPRKDMVVDLLLKPDLATARAHWIAEAKDPAERKNRDESDFLVYQDREGHFADFHSLRHTFITHVARSGLYFKAAQDLARHSTPELTAKYSHSFPEDHLAAVNSLPDLSSPSKNSALYSAFGGALSGSSVQPGADGGTGSAPVDASPKSRADHALHADKSVCDSHDGDELHVAATASGPLPKPQVACSSQAGDTILSERERRHVVGSG